MIGTFLFGFTLPQLWSLFSSAETCEAYSGYSAGTFILLATRAPELLSLLKFFSSSLISLALFSIVISRFLDFVTTLNFLISYS